MASAIVAAPTPTALDWLAERQIVIGARVGSCTVAHRGYGTVTAVRSTTEIVVAWDDATTETVTWSAIAPLGYVVEVAPVAASASIWASAATHLESRIEHVRIDGIRWAIVTSGNSGKVYRLPADASACPCKWNTTTGRQCSHMLALELAAMLDELATPPSADWPRCRSCRAVADHPGLCDPCASDQTRRLDQAAKRVAVAA